jgi:hypothetical protein
MRKRSKHHFLRRKRRVTVVLEAVEGNPQLLRSNQGRYMVVLKNNELVFLDETDEDAARAEAISIMHPSQHH